MNSAYGDVKNEKKQTKMYAQKENKKLLNNAESGTKDITDEKSNNYQPLKYNMKKFKAFTKTGIEFLFAPSKEQAQKMFYQLYPCGDLQNLTEVEFTIY